MHLGNRVGIVLSLALLCAWEASQAGKMGDWTLSNRRAGLTIEGAKANALSPLEIKLGWKSLWDGQTPTSWKGFLKSEAPAGWRKDGEALTRMEAGGDLLTKDKFDNFVFYAEWKIPVGGNSGVFFRGLETDGGINWSGPECSILDNQTHPDGQFQERSAGGVWGMYSPTLNAVSSAPFYDATSTDAKGAPTGYNKLMIIAYGNFHQVWLNGVKVVDYEVGTADWEARKKKTPFADKPQYGKALSGYIALQDHGNPVWYRNIKIRSIPMEAKTCDIFPGDAACYEANPVNWCSIWPDDARCSITPTLAYSPAKSRKGSDISSGLLSGLPGEEAGNILAWRGASKKLYTPTGRVIFGTLSPK